MTDQANQDPSAEPHEHVQVLTRDIQFADGRSAFAFERPHGETLRWDAHKSVQNPAERHMPATMIVVTESGNQYVLGHGMIIDTRKNLAHIIPEGADDQVPQLIFGEPWEIPGVLSTTPVRAVLAEDKKMRSGEGFQRADGPSPFVAANTLLRNKIVKAMNEGKLPDDMRVVVDQLNSYKVNGPIL